MDEINPIRVYDPQVTELERQLSGVAAMIYQIESCQFHPYPQDDVLKALRTIFRVTSQTIERLRIVEDAEWAKTQE